MILMEIYVLKMNKLKNKIKKVKKKNKFNFIIKMNKL